jgi:hypothetical protein
MAQEEIKITGRHKLRRLEEHLTAKESGAKAGVSRLVPSMLNRLRGDTA